jgi:hypothetical protein
MTRTGQAGQPKRYAVRPAPSLKVLFMHTPFFHENSDCVRFWVAIAGIAVGATISRETLQHRCAPRSVDADPLATFRTNQDELENAVRRRVARGAIEPVMIREADL